MTKPLAEVGSEPVAGDYSRLEERLNFLSHGVAALVSLIGTVVLIVLAARQSDPWKVLAFSIYGGSMTLLFLSSTLYHSATSPAARRLFKMLDHCAIFLLIAGTYTPFLLVNMRAGTGWLLFAIIWGLAAVGILLKLLYGHRLKALRVGIYLGMGWLIVFASSELAATVSQLGFGLVVAGGIVYTLGVVFYLVNRIPFNHAIWHLFVVGGSACHFLAVYYGVLNGQLV